MEQIENDIFSGAAESVTDDEEEEGTVVSERRSETQASQSQE